MSIRGQDGTATRGPHWWNALSQARIAAATLLGRTPDDLVGRTPPFFWTDAFGLTIRMAGRLPLVGDPTVIEGSIAHRRALLVWPADRGDHDFGTAAAVNIPCSAPKLATSPGTSPHAQGP